MEKNINHSRKKKNDIVFVCILLTVGLLGALFLFLSKTEGDTVRVVSDGSVVKEFSLSENVRTRIFFGDGYNELVIQDGKAFVEEASCPDGICVSHRPISNDGESIICLPNKLVVEVKTKKDNKTDIVA